MKLSAENMNIALVHEWLTNVAGSERVLLAVKEIYPDAPIFTSVFNPLKAKPFSKFEVRTSILQKIPFMRSKRELLIPFTPFAFEQFDFSKYNLVISNTSMAAKGIITKPEAIHISYCNTPPRYLWDPNIDPRAKKGKLSFLRNNVVHNMRIWDRVAADRVDYFLANSKYIAKRIKKYYGRESIVVYPPVDVESFKIAPKENIKDYYLFVSRLVNYKKCDLVIDAFNDLGLPLKIIGTGPDEQMLKKKAKNNIEFLGFLSDDGMKKYYSEAKAFIFPAEEDFGIVPVEAMASGRPVIAYGSGGATETVVEGVTGVFFDEQTPQCLIDTIKNFNPDDYNSAKIRQHSEKFSKDRFKSEFQKVVEEIISNHKF
ncbi:MAG: glycosyltransferase [Patescibacteria group bacterium]|nr:glycosyltransferase [Patescibacteria group bacterium]